MIKRILVANRSEIAERVIRTAKDLGITSVVGYADADLEANFTCMADEAFALGGSSYAETYMNGDKLLAVARRSGADAVHPGYGFLSEIPEFAQAVIDAGLIWIGPSPEVLQQLGDKIEARRLAESVGVQPVPGISDPVADRESVESFVAEWGYPIVTKKSDGGGGRGISIIRSDADLDHFFTAQGSNIGNFFVEKFIETARHVETQCMRDSHGNFAVVSTRDCSVQRRNQKLIEEAPAPGLTEAQVETLVNWSRQLFGAVEYVGLGTCEFLVEGDAIYFLEVNPRLQVEHTVSEEVTGLDLVQEQINIADGGTISDVPEVGGHSFEFRITCEDPDDNLHPSSGKITKLRWPLGHGIRIESGVEEGSVVTSDFDSMLAKLIVTGASREQAIARSLRALEELTLEGVATPAKLYRDIIADDVFASLGYSTRWFEEQFLPQWQDKREQRQAKAASSRLPNGLGHGVAEVEDERATVVIEINGRRTELRLPKGLFSGSTTTTRPQPLRRFARQKSEQTGKAGEVTGNVTSPIQAIVVRVLVEPGKDVAEGDLLVVLESMKMESYVYAPITGRVVEVHVKDSTNVTPGTKLIRIEPAPADES